VSFSFLHRQYNMNDLKEDHSLLTKIIIIGYLEIITREEVNFIHLIFITKN